MERIGGLSGRKNLSTHLSRGKNDAVLDHIIAHLEAQFESAKPILFLGAGFSFDALNIAGDRIPMPNDVKAKLWDLCFPGEPCDQTSTLQTVFEMAVLTH